MTCEGCKYYYPDSPCETLDDCCGNTSETRELDCEVMKNDR